MYYLRTFLRYSFPETGYDHPPTHTHTPTPTRNTRSVKTPWASWEFPVGYLYRYVHATFTITDKRHFHSAFFPVEKSHVEFRQSGEKAEQFYLSRTRHPCDSIILCNNTHAPQSSHEQDRDLHALHVLHFVNASADNFNLTETHPNSACRRSV